MVSVLSKVSATVALVQDFSMVSLYPSPQIASFTFLTPILQPFSPADAIHTGLGVLLTVWAPFRLCPYPFNIHVSQAFKGVSSDFNSVIELFDSIESFLNRLDIYTKVPPTPVMTEIIVKIMVELLSTLALATKQIRQGRPSKFVFADILPSSTQCREICKEAFRRE